MPVTAAEARAEREDTSRDLRDDGTPMLLVYDRNWRVSGGQRGAPDEMPVELYGLIGAASLRQEGGGVLAGDLVVTLADLDLGDLEGLPGLPHGGAPGPTGYKLYLGRGEEHPVPGDPGVQELRVLRLLETVWVGGWPVLHKVQARG